MTTNTSTRFLLLFTLTCITAFYSCKKEQPKIPIDEELYNLAKATSGFTWYKNTAALLAKSPGSGHFPPYLRTRYNSTAASKLDADGKVQNGASFPEGSLIVKELFADSVTFERYAILYKQSDNSNADANGWVWGYINADGSVSTSAVDKGAICISCHSQAGSIDYMLMNAYFP